MHSSQPPRTPRRIVRDGLRLIVRFIRRQPVAYGMAATGAVLFTSAIVASAYVIGRITDDLVVPVLTDGAPLADRLRTGVLMILGVAVWKSSGIVLRRSAAGWLQGRNQQRLQQDLVRHQLDLSLRWYGTRPTGDLLSVTDADARQATYVLAPLPFATGVAFLLFAATGLVLATDPVLGVLAGTLLVTVVSIDLRGAGRMFLGMEEEQRRKGVIGDIAHESFDGALTVKALGREDRESQRFAAATDALREQYFEIGRIWATYRVITEALPALGTVLIVLVGSARIASGALTTGELVQVAYLLSLLGLPMRMFGFLMWDLAESVAGWERVRTVLDVDDRVRHGDLPARPDGAATVTGDALSFAYGDGPSVLHDLSLDVSPGRTLAVVGPTGSGKSTLAILLARLWDPDRGSVRLDGRDLRRLTRGAVPAEVAYVSQDTFLFDDTVAGNITLGREVPRSEVEAAAALAGADGFVQALPQGYDTLVGERGTSLSGGQRQRIALARALLRRPRLLILDDATSALDPTVETRILARLTDAELPSTVVLVASRRSSIVLADEVCYLEGGRVVAVGRHERLLAEVPGYARLLDAYAEPDEAVGADGGAA